MSATTVRMKIDKLVYSLDFEGSLPPSAQDGMQRAIDHADPKWKAAASSCVFIAARKQRFITVDDVSAELETVNKQRKRDGLPEFETHNLDALGPLMVQSKSNGVIRNTGERVRSAVGKKHGNWHTKWESLVYPGGAE